MVSQSDFPPSWACDSEFKDSKLEIRIPEDRALGLYTWIEVPVVKAELYIEKGEAARIQRTAKVKIPTQWGKDTADVLHNSPRELLSRFDDEQSDPFLFARLSLKHPEEDSFIVSHFGWVGGIGPAEQRGVTKLWMYDVAELMQGIPITTTFNDPTVKSAADQIAGLVNDNSPIPLSDSYVVPPETEEEFSLIADVLNPDDIVSRTFSDVEIEGNTAYYYLAGIPAKEVKNIGSKFDSQVISTAPEAGPIANIIGQSNTETMNFTANHDTLADVVRAFEERTNAKVHFEPAPDGNSVVMVFDIVPERRVYAAESVMREKLRRGEFDYGSHETVKVIQNTSLYEMKPINTLYLRGDTSRSYRAPDANPLRSPYGVATNAGPELRFPSVKVQSPSILQAAEGFELAVTIESDAETLEVAEKQAVKELTKILEEPSEGSIRLFGHPRLLPFDRLDAFEACGEDIQLERDPVRYEIEGVKHTVSGKDTFTTRLSVSIWVNEDNIEIVESKLEEA